MQWSSQSLGVQKLYPIWLWAPGEQHRGGQVLFSLHYGTPKQVQLRKSPGLKQKTLGTIMPAGGERAETWGQVTANQCSPTVLMHKLQNKSNAKQCYIYLVKPENLKWSS